MARVYYRDSKKGKRTWYIDYLYEGRRIRKRVGPSRKLALLALSDIEIKIARKQYNLAPSDISVPEFMEKYDEYSQVNHAPQSYTRYRNIITNFLIYLGDRQNMKLSQLTPRLFEEYKIFRRKHPENRTLL